jgi:hypothetical protein
MVVAGSGLAGLSPFFLPKNPIRISTQERARTSSLNRITRLFLILLLAVLFFKQCSPLENLISVQKH